MSSWAKPGVKCVCIDASGRVNGVQYEWRGDAPIAGETYTIRRVWAAPGGDAVMDFVELQRLTDGLGYGVYRFRPLVEPKTEAQDVAMFKSLIGQKIDA
jgi:hypothetical protein